jgi:hypothetical protein
MEVDFHFVCERVNADSVHLFKGSNCRHFYRTTPFIICMSFVNAISICYQLRLREGVRIRIVHILKFSLSTL